jgi:hypothetical protein
MSRLPLHPGHPERVCWGCHYHCPPHDLRCGNGTDRAQHPAEIFGEDWLEVGLDAGPHATSGETGARNSG